MIDPNTNEWRTIAAKIHEIVESGRSRLEQNDQSYGESQFIRGRISAMRELLEMVRPTVVVTAPPHELKPRDRSGV